MSDIIPSNNREQPAPQFHSTGSEGLNFLLERRASVSSFKEAILLCSATKLCSVSCYFYKVGMKYWFGSANREGNFIIVFTRQRGKQCNKYKTGWLGLTLYSLVRTVSYWVLFRLPDTASVSYIADLFSLVQDSTFPTKSSAGALFPEVWHILEHPYPDKRTASILSPWQLRWRWIFART